MIFIYVGAKNKIINWGTAVYVTSSCVLCAKAGPADDDAIWSGAQLFSSTPLLVLLLHE